MGSRAHIAKKVHFLIKKKGFYHAQVNFIDNSIGSPFLRTSLCRANQTPKAERKTVYRHDESRLDRPNGRRRLGRPKKRTSRLGNQNWSISSNRTIFT
jgi:hypothetical protein